ncbi:hypothetical protein Belba_1305 [Belliella baltica DSM 15883]|uniref:DUF5777 domain-containing protein n=1 Tax=Belliella baltica (strain DSM 15883 / CIP 108006 / LMG 21964 / BA134) TaxID=866536 RepID=I3Z3W4_BELBD|nr:DUF5777 family beta-barrel protein [Belliella baltica]AFL83932.1 hypothetical protein Belba_1305 [Belliella baltica DSM 15883]
MKNTTLLLMLFCFMTFTVAAQEEDSIQSKKVDKPERAAFQSGWLIDNPTGLINSKGTFQFDIQHRFGVIESGNRDLLGMWGPANIRLALSYAISNRITLGFGTLKDSRMQDFNLKAGLLQQTRSGSVPVSLAYYGNVAIDARESEFFPESSNRFAYFNQLIFTRRFNRIVSMQIAPSYSHYNLVSPELDNSQFAVALGGKVSISDKTSILIDYSQPLSQNTDNPGLSLGIEMSTGLHAFQVFVGNYNGILPQRNYILNKNRLSENQFLIGFNINRLWF